MSNVYKYEEQTLTRNELLHIRNIDAKKLRSKKVIVNESSFRKRLK